MHAWISQWVHGTQAQLNMNTEHYMIIANNVNSVCVDYWTTERVIIASNLNDVNVDDCETR